ncbi:peptidase C1B bleomycin hydrolase [Flagelloscypha sp. PMI_526]|nr:peptidase C1B bleomycin hydrolase [Flagelloscypha sp. PMI_526]
MGSNASKPASASQIDEKLSMHVQSLSLDTDIKTPTSVDGTLTLANLSSWENDIASSSKAQLARTILHRANLADALTRREATIADVHVFNHEVPFETWSHYESEELRPLLVVRYDERYDIMKTLNLKEFQLSQSYPFFYDKLNKSNYYLELSIQHADLPVDDRLIVHLADDLISDGGQWEMSVNILDTYGVVPQAIYPESATSSSSRPLNTLLKTKLREHALILRKMSASLKAAAQFSAEQQLMALRAKKEELLAEIYTIMSATLGKPPRPDEPFVWEYYDANGKVGRWEGTPREYFNAFASKKFNPLNSFSLINDPRNDYSKLYTVDKLGNLVGGRPVLYVNTEIENMKTMIIKMIKAGQPVFFGCDVGASSNSTAGIMDTALFDFENTFDITLGLTKAERLQVNESAMTHAYGHFGSSSVPRRKACTRSKTHGVRGVVNKGYFVMTDAWFDQLLCPKALAPKELVAVLETEAIVLPPWDPMGALA